MRSIVAGVQAHHIPSLDAGGSKEEEGRPDEAEAKTTTPKTATAPAIDTGKALERWIRNQPALPTQNPCLPQHSPLSVPMDKQQTTEDTRGAANKAPMTAYRKEKRGGRNETREPDTQKRGTHGFFQQGALHAELRPLAPSPSSARPRSRGRGSRGAENRGCSHADPGHPAAPPGLIPTPTRAGVASSST